MMTIDEARTFARVLADTRPRGRGMSVLTVVDFAILLYLAGGEASIDGLATALDLPTSTTVERTAVLAAAGFAAKVKDHVDHRVTWSVLTPKGRRALLSAKAPPLIAQGEL